MASESLAELGEVAKEVDYHTNQMSSKEFRDYLSRTPGSKVMRNKLFQGALLGGAVPAAAGGAFVLHQKRKQNAASATG